MRKYTSNSPYKEMGMNANSARGICTKKREKNKIRGVSVWLRKRQKRKCVTAIKYKGYKE